MRRVLAAAVVIISLGVAALPASAAGPVTRDGVAYNGVRDPGACEVMPDQGTWLHVKCLDSVGATGPAYVRYRFLKDVGAVRAPATVSADLRDPAGCAIVRWMAPVRTLRIEVPLGCYIDIKTVTWQQP